MKTLIIVESPTKAKTISKFLGKDYIVKSSFGHIRDLPKKKMGIDTEHNFEMEYEIPERSQKTITELRNQLSKVNRIILATDEDREGEAIAWHLIKALNLNEKECERIVFHEITKNAIEEALKNPRKLNMNLVNAQQARRALDRLVGYELSPFLWKKVRRGLSAGRVQSVAVRLIAEREEEIKAFKQEEYWTIESLLKKQTDDKDNSFEAKLVKKNDKTLDKFAIKNDEDAQKIKAEIEKEPFVISNITKKQTKKKPIGPFTTSTLQQTASNKLGFSTKETMMLAQQLYEGIPLENKEAIGLITYMRTDSTSLSKEAVAVARDYIVKEYGKDYLPGKPASYKTKSKSAQEAHESIRPTFPDRSPASIQEYLNPKQFKLYDLIWRRMIACQMQPALIDQTSVDINAGIYTFRSNGSIITFDGFLKIYVTQTKEKLLPALEDKETLDLIELKPNQHFTEPPPRYTEASLVKSLEEEGIGRPSTYAPTISTIQDREYVIKNEDKKFEPTETGMLVNKVLVEHFANIVNLKFTATMEKDLDKIATGEKEWQPILKSFYMPFKENLQLKDKEVDRKDITEEKTDVKCDKCGSDMVIKLGRFGKFMACSNYPDCKNTHPLPGEEGKKPPEAEKSDEKCEKCGQPMVYKVGRYGKFLGCSGYPDCKNIKSIKKLTGVKCPDCEKGDILEKKSKRGKVFFACSEYPNCKFALWNKPTGEKCPKCNSLVTFAAKGKAKCSSKNCDYITDVKLEDKNDENN